MQYPAQIKLSNKTRAHLRPISLAVHLGLNIGIAIGFSDIAYAQVTTINYDIPAGPLAESLSRFAQQSGVAIAIDANKMQGLSAPRLQGSYALEDGFNILLKGSGYTVEKTEAGYVLIPAPIVATSENAEYIQNLPTVKVSGQKESPEQLNPAYAGGQVARGGRLGLLGNKDVMDAPFSIVSYTEKTIRDQQVTSIAEVLTTTDSSVRASIGSSNRYDALTIRGFRVDNDELALNGLYGLVPAYRIGPDPVERIELLKGPGAFLNGMLPWGSVGGGVNIVTKRADATPLTRFTAEYLSDSRIGGHLDVGRRFGENNEFGVRANGAFRGGDSGIDGQSVQNGSGSLGLDYQGERARVSADIIYQDDWMRAAARGYTPVAGIQLPKAPDPKVNLAQSFDYANAKSFTGLSRGEFDLTPRVTLFGAIGMNRFDYDKQEAPGATILNTQGDATSTSKYQKGRSEAVSAEAGIRAQVDTGPVFHQLVLSANTMHQTTWLGQTLYGNYATNIYSPVRLTSAGSPVSTSAVTKSGESTLQSIALADTLSIKDGLVQLTLGARHQQVETSYFAASGVRTDYYDEGAVTPSVALVVRPTNQISLYGNYIEALTAGAIPPADAANVNQVFAPYKSKQYEVGSKFDFGRFGATLSLFQISVPSGVVDPVSKIYSLNGEQRNQGIELNGFGELTNKLRLLGGVTLLDAELRHTQSGVSDGNHAIGAPGLQANMGLEWDTLFVPGLTLTGRAIHTSNAYVSADNTQQVPSWTRLDIGARYLTAINSKPVTVRANVTNLLDKNYWEANPTGYLISGMPRTLWLSVATDF